ncbi:MAG: calcium/sodium antiporter [Candidatus Fermentibacter sp.]|nr:calcium/sodium antiporter [Candidatus Fermentibacter sp.]
MDAALFVLGLLLLWGSSEVIIRNITPLARFLGVKELVVTVLGVSVLSSLPELTVSAFAIARGASDISVGNVIGSNFVTLTFVTAVCALFHPIDIHREVQERESSWMILSSALVLILSMDGLLSRSDGCILIILYVPYIISVLRTAREGAEPRIQGISRFRAVYLPLVLILVGIAGVIGSSKLALDSGTRLAEAAGISALAMGVVLFAFGTSLPELAISLSATLKRKADVTIGEVYASNIFTQMVVLGICCLISPIAVSSSMLSFAMPFLVLATVVIQLFVTSNLRITRLEAVGLLLFYAVFAASQFFDLPGVDSVLGF